MSVMTDRGQQFSCVHHAGSVGNALVQALTVAKWSAHHHTGFDSQCRAWKRDTDGAGCAKEIMCLTDP